MFVLLVYIFILTNKKTPDFLKVGCRNHSLLPLRLNDETARKFSPETQQPHRFF
ncbi:hypothetical protein ES705_25754 [subsurface metagenome]